MTQGWGTGGSPVHIRLEVAILPKQYLQQHVCAQRLLSAHSEREGAQRTELQCY